MSAVLFDTSVYIAALRRGDASILSLRRVMRTEEGESAQLWLSVVVLEEFYAGALERPAIKSLERMERDFTKAGRLLVPNAKDWTLAGRVLAKLGIKYGFEQIGRSRLTNDALIAMSAGRNGIAVLTVNPRDYARIAQARSFSWEQHSI